MKASKLSGDYNNLTNAPKRKDMVFHTIKENTDIEIQPIVNADRAIGDGQGNNIIKTYAKKDEIPTFFTKNYFFNKVDNQNATLLDDKPTTSNANYLDRGVSINTEFDWEGSQKIVTTRTTSEDITFGFNNSISVTLSVAFDRESQVEYGARAYLITDTSRRQIASNQVFGMMTYPGESSMTKVTAFTFHLVADLLEDPIVIAKNSVIQIEIFKRQYEAIPLKSYVYCGAIVGGMTRQSYMTYNITNQFVNTNQITDGAITEPKLSLELSDKIISKVENITTPIVTIDNAMGNTIYTLNTPTSVTITAVEDTLDEIVFTFNIGATVPTINLPESLKGADKLEFTTNSEVRLAILDNVIVGGSF